MRAGLALPVRFSLFEAHRNTLLTAPGEDAFFGFGAAEDKQYAME
jgi:hypothetical protein